MPLALTGNRCRRAPGGGYETIKARLEDEVADWLADNTTGRWEASVGTQSRIAFANIADAVLFKIRWL